MKLSEIFARLLQRLRAQPNPPVEGSASSQTQEALKALLRNIEMTQDIELTCDETFELLDQYAEMVSRGENPAQLLPLVRHHLEICPACREELEALLTVLQNAP